MQEIKNKVKLGTVQFYISHTCNLGCDNCLSYNNFLIKGHDKFSDYSTDAVEWSRLVDPNDMSIIGGEPLSNPDVNNWVVGVRDLFPNCKDFKVCTNGTMIMKHVSNILNWWDKNVILEVHAHTVDHFEKSCKDIETIIGNKVYKKTNSTPANSPEYYNEDFDVFYIVDDKLVAVVAAPYNFKQWGVNAYKNNQWELYNSNPKIAHMMCVANDCHYIYKGQMYKCGTIVGAKEFVKTYKVKQEHADLINAYTPISWNDESVENDLITLTKNSIDQCALCPSINKWTAIENVKNKSKIGLT